MSKVRPANNAAGSDGEWCEIARTICTCAGWQSPTPLFFFVGNAEAAHTRDSTRILPKLPAIYTSGLMTDDSPVVAKTILDSPPPPLTTTTTKGDNHQLTTDISIPFESDRHADIIARSLLVDILHEGKRMSAGITKEISSSRNELLIRFSTASAKSLRVNVNSILDLVAVLIDTVANFDSVNIPAAAAGETPTLEEQSTEDQPKNGNSPSSPSQSPS